MSQKSTKLQMEEWEKSNDYTADQKQLVLQIKGFAGRVKKAKQINRISIQKLWWREPGSSLLFRPRGVESHLSRGQSERWKRGTVSILVNLSVCDLKENIWCGKKNQQYVRGTRAPLSRFTAIYCQVHREICVLLLLGSLTLLGWGALSFTITPPRL